MARARDLDSGDDRDERKPLRQVGGSLRDHTCQLRRELRRRSDGGNLPPVPEQALERRIRSSPGIDVAVAPQHFRVGARLQLGQQPRLAHAGLSDHLHDLPDPVRRRAGNAEQRRQLLVAPPERRLVEPLAGRGRCPDAQRVDRGTLALGDERRVLAGREAAARARDELARDQELPRGGVLRQAGGEVRTVAHQRIGPAIGRPVVAGEDAPGCRARAERDPAGGVERRAERRDHPVLVATDPPGRPGAEQHLAPIGSDVGDDVGDVVGGGCRLKGGDDVVESDLGRARSALQQQPIHPAEPQEADRGMPVLALEPPAENVLAQVAAEGDARVKPGEVQRLPGRRG